MGHASIKDLGVADGLNADYWGGEGVQARRDPRRNWSEKYQKASQDV
jgi:hypothetical protein